MVQPVKVIRQGMPAVTIVRNTTIVKVTPINPAKPFSVVPFFITAEQDQSAFNLPSAPKTDGLFIVAINGTMQSGEAGDYIISGNVLTFNAGLDSGDKVFGLYEKN